MIPHNIKNKLYLIFLPLFLLLLLQCGLNTYPYIYPPDIKDRQTGSDGPFTIVNRGDNDPDVFIGYELYYKFYNQSDATAAMQNDDNSIFGVEQPTPSDVTRLGFKRVNTVPRTDSQPQTRYPMIPINYGDRSNNFNITLDFTGVSSKTAESLYAENLVVIPKVTYLGYGNVSLYRQVIDPDVQNTSNTGKFYKSFGDISNNNPSSRDADLLSIPSTSRVTVSLYVFSYGKYEKVYNIYSKPLWLGYIDYDQRD